MSCALCLQTEAPSQFDSRLPPITGEDVEFLREQVPELSSNLKFVVLKKIRFWDLKIKTVLHLTYNFLMFSTLRNSIYQEREKSLNEFMDHWQSSLFEAKLSPSTQRTNTNKSSTCASKKICSGRLSTNHFQGTIGLVVTVQLHRIFAWLIKYIYKMQLKKTLSGLWKAFSGALNISIIVILQCTGDGWPVTHVVGGDTERYLQHDTSQWSDESNPRRHIPRGALTHQAHKT